MRKTGFPDKNEWDKIVEDAFSSDETHIFSDSYNEKKARIRGSVSVKRNSNIKRAFAGFAAAAAVCAGALAIAPLTNVNDRGTTPELSEAVQQNSFFISASAEEAEIPEVNISITPSHESSCFPYSGSFFFIHGTNIKNISISIDKGSLYKADYKKMITLNDDDKPVYTEEDYSEYIGSSYTGAFNENICYGFYFPEEVIESHEKKYSEKLRKKAIYDCYNDFDGALLSLTAEFEDGTEKKADYILKSGMLEIDPDTMTPVPNKFSDGSTPYIYGFYFENIVYDENGNPAPHKAANYPVNENGETYGTCTESVYTDDMPDLISAEGDNGVPGYVKKSDLLGTSPSSPEEAVKLMEESKNTPNVINVYASDGKTIVDIMTEQIPN